jgi:HD-like signal output (HDOD) protein/CheY-like chemotaxis protein
MKRILFVDDDPLVFEGLQRMLAPQNGQWEMSFAPEGETALVLLAATPFDVVVSDLRMPKMDGAVLLKTVRERWPSVVRIILSGKADMEDAVRAAPVAHQCLLKPCDPAMLRSAIERATNLSELLSSKLLAGIVGSVQDLPVMPRAYIELRDALSNPNYSLKKIVRIVEQDVGISAKILQLVNSAFFGLPKDISSVHNAVCYLGAEMLQNLVLSAEVFHVFEKGKAIKKFSFEDLHIHSQLTAKIAGSLLPPSPTRDAATIAGLLHDVGKLILATRSPQHFARAIQGSRVEKLPLFVVEQQLMGVSHAEVGAYLLGLWGLPAPVVEAVAHHHVPGKIPSASLDAVGAVHIANALANEHPVYPPAKEPLPQQGLDEEFINALGLADQAAHWEEVAKAAALGLRSPATVAR